MPFEKRMGLIDRSKDGPFAKRYESENPYSYLTDPLYMILRLADLLEKADPKMIRKIKFHMEELLDEYEETHKVRNDGKEAHTNTSTT